MTKAPSVRGYGGRRRDQRETQPQTLTVVRTRVWRSDSASETTAKETSGCIPLGLAALVPRSRPRSRPGAYSALPHTIPSSSGHHLHPFQGWPISMCFCWACPSWGPVPWAEVEEGPQDWPAASPSPVATEVSSGQGVSHAGPSAPVLIPASMCWEGEGRVTLGSSDRTPGA